MRRRFSWDRVALRFLLALAVVAATYNPTGTSFWHWISADPLAFTPAKGILAVVLVIGWVVLLRATFNSLGGVGIALAGALFGVLLWGLMYWGIVPSDSFTAMKWVGVMVIVGILTVGICWSHVRRRLSGQYDVDELDEP